MTLRKFVAAIALAVLMLPTSAHATTYNHITNGNFSSNLTGWSSTGTIATVGICGGGSSKRVQLDPGEYVEQTFTASQFSLWELTATYHLINDTDNYYDQLTMSVTNNSTSVTEGFYLRGSTWTNCGGGTTSTMSNDYDNISVTVRFEVSSLSTSGWYIDNVGFWGTT